MVKTYHDRQEESTKRITLRSASHTFTRIIAEGTNCSAFEAGVIAEKAQEVFRLGEYAEDQALQPAQMIWQAIAEEELNKGNMDVIDEILSPAVLTHTMKGEEKEQTQEDIKQFNAGMRKCFPDFQYLIEDIIAEGDKVVARFAGIATKPDSNERMSAEYAYICRFEEGKIAEVWYIASQLIPAD